MNVLLNLWPRIESVHASLSDLELRRQSLLLARLLVSVVALGSISVILQLMWAHNFKQPALSLALSLGLLGIAYGLNRRGQYHAAGVIAVVAMLAGCFLLLSFNPQNALTYAYFVVPLFLARLFLSGQFFVALSAVTVVGLVSGPWLWGAHATQAALGAVFIALVSILFGIARQHRNAIERERRAALVASERELRAILDNMQDTYFRTDIGGRIVRASESATQLLGYAPAEVFRKKLATFYDEAKGRKRLLAALKATGGALSNYEVPMRHRNGSIVWVSTNAQYVRGAGDRIIGIEGTARDITGRMQAEAQMRKLSSAIEQTADLVLITNRDGVIEYVNPAFVQVTGFRADEAVGCTPRLIKSGNQGTAFYRKMWETILAGTVYRDVIINRRKDGSLYYEEKTITPLKDGDGHITNFVSTGKDVTERMQAQERLEYMAQHDTLTALPNRALLLDRLNQSVARARWHRRRVAVLFIDVDRFKTINDTLGHEAGDRLLQQLGERFGACVREGDTVARFGGDEFVILLGDLASDQDVVAVAQKILEALHAPFDIEGQSLYVTASIGISLFPSDGEDSSALLKNSDIAMYRAKELGRNTYQFYSADMSARAFERLSLETSLRHALERGEFRLHYQPQVDTVTGRIVAIEALLRWQHPDLGLVLPNEFVALLEETGLILPVGDWVLEQACTQLRRWQLAGWPTLRMAINLSPRQFQHGGVVQAFRACIARLNVVPGTLELEITEGMLVQQAGTTLESLDALRTAGVRLAIDDFGTGYSSLSYLRRFHIDTLKIDRGFVHDIPGDPDDSAITAAIAALASSLKLEMVAEGVENAAQRDYLRTLGCTVMQGFLFSRPVSADEVSALLERHNPIH